MNIGIVLEDGIRETFCIWQEFLKRKNIIIDPCLYSQTPPEFDSLLSLQTQPYFACDPGSADLNGRKNNLIEIFYSQEWNDTKNLITPFVKAEDKINTFYDLNHKIYIFAYPEDQEWLDSHFIPYDELIVPHDIRKSVQEKEINIWIDGNASNCFNVLNCESAPQSFIITQPYHSTEYITTRIGIPYSLPNKVQLTTWSKIIF